MKKYVKPELFYERYELSQHIADCAWELTSAKPEDCAAVGDEKLFGEGYPDLLFTDTAGSCTLLDKDYEDFCYQAGTSPFMVMNS